MKLNGWGERGSPGRGVLAAIAFAALALRLWHLDWGLPDLYEEATPLFKAWGFWNWRGSGLDFNPHFFNYPALSLIVQFALQAARYGAGVLAGIYPDGAAFQNAWSSDLPGFILAGRIPGVLCDVGTVAIVGLLAGRIVSRRAGLLAAVIAAVNPLQIRLSQMIAVDSMLMFFSSLALLVMLDVVQSGGMKKALQAGLLVGLAASTKYTGAVLLAPLVCAILLGLRRNAPRDAVGTVSSVMGPVILAYGVFVVLNPYILLDSASFLRDFGFEQAHMVAGHFGVQASTPTPVYYLLEALPQAIGWPAMVLGLLGSAWAVRNGDRRWVLAALGFGSLLLLPMFWTMRAERYLLPALPGLILLVAAGLEWFYPPSGSTRNVAEPQQGRAEAGPAVGSSGQGGSDQEEPAADVQGQTGSAGGRPGLAGDRVSRRWAMLTVLVLTLAALIPPVLATARYHRSLFEPDTRAAAADWIRRVLPPGSALALTPAGVNVDSAYVQFPIPYIAVGLEGIVAVYDARWYTDMDLLVGSDFDRARFLQEPARYSEFVRFFYDSLETRWRTVWSAEPGPTRQGPRIWLFAPPVDGRGTLFPPDLISRLETVTTPRTLTVFAANLASVLDARGRSDRARQVRVAAIDQLLRRFPGTAPASIEFLSSMAVRPRDVRAMADSLRRGG